MIIVCRQALSPTAFPKITICVLFDGAEGVVVAAVTTMQSPLHCADSPGSSLVSQICTAHDNNNHRSKMFNSEWNSRLLSMELLNLGFNPDQSSSTQSCTSSFPPGSR